MTIQQAIEQFKGTNKWASYSEQTQRQYAYLLQNSLDLDVNGTLLGDMHMSDMDKDTAELVYTLTSERGTTVANQTRTAFNALYSTLTGASPFRGLERNTAGKKTVTKAHLQTFLTAAYSKFKWRNAGLLVQMVYELGQDMKDLLELTWEDVDFLDSVIHVNGVALAASEDLMDMLDKQVSDFGFQQWVVPNPNINKNDGYTPYGQTQISRTLKKIREYANLPEEFNLQEVRRLGFMAMLADGYTKPELAIVARATDLRDFNRTIDRLRKDM